MAETIIAGGPTTMLLAPTTALRRPTIEARRIRILAMGVEQGATIDRALYFRPWYVHIPGRPVVAFEDPQVRNLSLAIIEARWQRGSAWISTEHTPPAAGWPE